MKIGHTDVIAIAAFLLVLDMVLLWTIDVSITAIAEDVKQSVMDTYNIPYKHLGGDTGMTNGFFRALSPVQMYHICLWILILTNFLFFLLVLHRFPIS